MGQGKKSAKSRQQAASTKKNEPKTPKNDEPLINLQSEAESSSSDTEKVVNNNERSLLDHQLALQENVNVFPLKKIWKSTSLLPLLPNLLQLPSKILQLRVPKTLRSRSQGL